VITKSLQGYHSSLKFYALEGYMNEPIKTKICTKCKTEKPIEMFCKQKASKDGIRPQCKKCDKAYRQANRDVIAERTKVYQKANAEKIAKYKKAYFQTHAEKTAEYQKDYYQANAESIIERTKVYYQANTGKIAERTKVYQKANAEKIVEYSKAYFQDNCEKLLKQSKAYKKSPIGKAVQKNARYKRRSITKQGDVTSAQLLDLTTNAKVCYWCNTSLKSKKVHVYHYTPLSKGGEHTLSNLVVTCAKCNLTKNAKDPIVFAQSIGRLL